jgi:metal-responsive CopG/Arc/MetJ family transcriptional regulator
MNRKPVTVSLPQELVNTAGQFCRRRSRTLSEVVRDAMKDYLLRENWEEARHRFTVHIQRKGLSSEQDLISRLED